GYGNAGQHAHRLAAQMFGSRVVAASDSRGGVHDPAGLDPLRLAEHKERHGQLEGFPGARRITNEELLELDVDVLVPAGIENQLRKDNAARVKASIVLELANGPTTPEADAVLHRAGKLVVPDFLANSGGVTVSYFEWVQNLYGYAWSEGDVHQKLDAKMTSAFHAVYETHARMQVDMRTAAYVVAVARVAEAVRLRGVVDCPPAAAPA
ncbi:MAG TPA: glutamate dehydrogenase, partial [Candidatus Thermoplasmatota archaeon]|nr:glutamate dehydrogenase [Candidatus Thermoplasmatota archaeon]